MNLTPPNPPSESPPSEESELVVLSRRGQRERRPANSIRGHDFRQSGFLTPSELRGVRLRHAQFIRSLAARLAIFLRLEFALQLSKVQIVGYLKFTETLPSPTHITLFKTDPLKGVGLLVIPPGLGLTIVDRLLGGPGQKPDAVRDQSEIEIALTDQIATLILTEWCNHWPEMKELRPSLLGEGNPQVKAARRRKRALNETKMLAQVPKADVVVTNPTHIAIALRYDRKSMRAPKVVAKGIRLNAQRIREIAEQHQVPIIENKSLARMLFKHSPVGGEVPAQLYAAVAEVLAWVYRVNRYRYYTEQNQV